MIHCKNKLIGIRLSQGPGPNESLWIRSIYCEDNCMQFSADCGPISRIRTTIPLFFSLFVCFGQTYQRKKKLELSDLNKLI